MKNYEKDKKVLFLEFTDGHDFTSEVIQYLDDHIYQFLNELDKSKILDSKTSLMVLTDHGQHLTSVLKLIGDMQMYNQERYLPLLIWMYSKDLILNEEVK